MFTSSEAVFHKELELLEAGTVPGFVLNTVCERLHFKFKF